MAELWRLTDLLVVNETEATALTEVRVQHIRSALAAGRRLTAAGPAMVAVTLGAQGAAAGDAWVGAVAALNAAAAGSAAGALAASRPGARPSLPRREEVIRLAAQIALVDLA